MAQMMPEMLAARAITKTINTLDFNADQFAIFFARGGTAIERRFFNLFLGMARHWSTLIDEGAVDEHDGKYYNMCVYSKRILDICPAEV